MFAAVYKLAETVSNILKLSSPAKAEVLLAAPKTLQAIIAAFGDFYTWKLATLVYGDRSTASWAVLVLTVVSPWQWFCSTRTLSNCLETTLTIVALYNWPWHWSSPEKPENAAQTDEQGLTQSLHEESRGYRGDETVGLRRALLLAAIATILRPTNVLIWLILLLSTALESYKSESLVRASGTKRSALLHLTAWQIFPTKQEQMVFLRETVLCGGSALLLSLFVDRLFYQEWAFPPLNFLYINVVQSLAVFYGNNNWHYYISEGYPLLLTTALPFAVLGLISAFPSTDSTPTNRHLAIICILVPAALSLISHKEVRFIYPLLPAMHILAASQLASYFGPSLTHSTTHPRLTPPYRLTKRIILTFLLTINLIIALYTTTIHNSGLISITHYLRHELESHYSLSSTSHNLTAAFLMPCHSTPWRSHLQHPSINAWALTCEPPLNLPALEKSTYLDEADAFYSNPSLWIKRHMSRHAPLSFKTRTGVFASEPGRRRTETHLTSAGHPWPEYLIFFAQLERTLQTTLQGSGYTECARFFNSQWHDDWRRRGDVVVWCLYPERAVPRVGSRFEDLTKGSVERIWEESQETRDALKQMGVGVKRIWEGHRRRLPVSSTKEVVDERHGLPGLSVEKPFWKQRPMEAKVKSIDEVEKWRYKIPGLRPARKTWWQVW